MTLASLLVIGCSAPPDEELAAAEAEIERARQAQAETWAPAEFEAARSALDAGRVEIATQSGKWFKGYSKARELLEHARAEAIRAAELAPGNRQRIARDAETALGAADSSLVIADASLQGAPGSPDFRSVLRRLRSELATLRTTLDEAHRSYESGVYNKALEDALAVKTQAADISTELDEARRSRGIHPVK